MKTNLLCQILECWYLDVNFLNDLLDNYQIELDIDEIKSNFGKIDINILIYETFEIIKNQFLEDNKEEIENIWFDIYELDYQIYTNYFDSHLWFNDNEIDELYQKWKS
jgi:hypothetical protein